MFGRQRFGYESRVPRALRCKDPGSSRIVDKKDSAMIGTVSVQMTDHLSMDAHHTYRGSKGSEVMFLGG